MKKRVFSCFLTLFLSIGLISNVTAAQADAPKLFLEGKAFDFGKVDEGQTIEHAFTVYNKGNLPLKIEKVQPD